MTMVISEAVADTRQTDKITCQGGLNIGKGVARSLLTFNNENGKWMPISEPLQIE